MLVIIIIFSLVFSYLNNFMYSSLNNTLLIIL